LEFWEVYRNSDPGVLQALGDADNALKAGMDTTQMKNDTAKMAGAGPLLSALTPSNPQQSGPTAVIGSAEKNKMNSITAMLESPQIKARFPQDMVFRWSKDPVRGRDGKASTLYELYALKKARGKSGPALEGDHVTRATAQPDPMSGEVAVSLSMDGTGAAIWSELTGRAAADNRREVAIVLDDEVVSAPHVNDKISGGNSSITGNYTVQEAQDMASKLEVGKLPAKTEIVQEATVGPSLGAENIQKSLISLGVALLAIVGFMVYYYGSGGIVAVVALLLNLFFIVGALTSMGTVLTLPGIASIILTMGIAVDANVIVYERIREELTAGKNLWQAIKDGFIHATPAIVDGNVTNIIAAVVLGYFGLGPVKGFAITLLVGVLFTLFTSLLVSRLIIDWWTQDKNKDIKFSTPNTENLFKDINIDWMAMRYKTYMMSGAFILAGLVAFFVRGFDLGVDLKGGYSYNVQFDKKVNSEEVRKTLETAFDKQSTIVKAVSTANTFNITTSYKINEVSTEAQEQVTTKLYEGLKGAGMASTTYEQFKSTYLANSGTHITSASKVGPMVADDIKSSSLKANFLALTLIFLYILLRFRRWQYSTGAVIALFHDVLFILACFTLFHGFLPFSLEVDQAIIAAVLTISAYSMNDTVIVYDRIREYARTYNNLPMRDIINKAINSTLSRTIITSFNVLLVVLILFIFGGSSIKGFAFALIVGIFIGTYSSIFIASPVMLDLSKNLNLSENSPNPVLGDVESLNALSKQNSK
jgi:SecD/SecF fusion protein